MQAADTLEAEREWEEAEAARLEREAEEAARQAEMEALVGDRERRSMYSRTSACSPFSTPPQVHSPHVNRLC